MTLLQTRSTSGATSVRRWLIQSISRENILASIKTISWLAPLTVLIWIYAERRQVDTTPAPGEAIPIEIVSSDPNIYVKLQLRLGDTNVTAQLRGPRVWIEDVRQKIAPQPSNPFPVKITIPPNLTPGQIHELDTAELLMTSPVFAHGVTPFNCKPARLPVLVDAYVDRDAEVKASGITNLAGPPVFVPPRIKIRGPSKVLGPPERVLIVEADLALTGLLGTPGRQEAPVVRLRAPGLEGESITLTPATVQASFDVRTTDDKFTYSSITVWAVVPPQLEKQYFVEKSSTIPNVTVFGPPEKIADMKREDAPKPRALLEVMSDDRSKIGQRQSRRLRYDGLPEGVRVSDEDAQRVFEFTLQQRSAE